jgi:hypothetical protein|tara:strand:+ start:1226 stop:1393 length:168 start_codon:yes stop_codon:yes gene_type:complete
MITYLIAVKFKGDREVQIYKFDTQEERLIYSESLRHLDHIEDVSYSQIERENDES